MKHLVQITMCSLALTALAAAAPVVADTKVYPADGVRRVVFTLPGELVIKPGPEEKLIVQAEPKVLAKIDVATQGDTLTLRSKGSFKTDQVLRFTLTIKRFRSLRATGSGSSEVEGFSGGDMEIEAGGSGDIDLRNLRPERIDLSISGSSDIAATGSARTLVARIEGSGNIEAESLPARTVKARLEGSGTIRVHAQETLEAVLNGAGDIEYKGKARVSKTINGAGSIEPM